MAKDAGLKNETCVRQLDGCAQIVERDDHTHDRAGLPACGGPPPPTEGPNLVVNPLRSYRQPRNNEKERAARLFGSNRICGLILHHRPSSRSRGMRLLLLLRVVSTLPLAMTRRS